MKNKLMLTLIVCMLHYPFLYSQSNHNSNISTSGTPHAEPLGWITGGGSVSNDLDIDNNFSSKNINISTFNGSLLKRMTILSTGEVGLGNFTPSFKLDIDAGDINLNSFSNGYRIGGSGGTTSSYVLWHNGDASSIYVGVGAGNSGIYGAGGRYNSLIGNNAGFNIGSASNNTAIGCSALWSNISANNNTAVGLAALYSIRTNYGHDSESENTAVGDSALFNTLVYGGCALGYRAGFGNVHGCSLVAIGEEAAYFSMDGNDNTAIGEAALRNNKYLSRNIAMGKVALEKMHYDPGFRCDTDSAGHATTFGCVYSNNVAIGNEALRFTNPSSSTSGVLDNGKNNTAIGISSGTWNKTGYNNCFVGYQADINPVDTNSTFFNSAAIGANATLKGSNQIILGGNTGGGTGTNDVKVGIGLSNDGTFLGPRSKLEINADASHMNVYNSGTAGSGLQFRQLTSSSPTNNDTYFPPYGKVLTVDTLGKVKLTDALGFGVCSTIPTLTSSIGINLNKFHVYFEGKGYSHNANNMNSSIGLGYNCGDVLPGKLSVNQEYSAENVDVPTTAGYFHNGDTTSDASSDFEKRAVWGISDGTTHTEFDNTWSLTNIGGDFGAYYSERTNIGVRGMTRPGSDGINYNVGGWFEGNSANYDNVGVYASTDGLGSGVNYGIYAHAPVGSCNNGSCAQAAGFFDGDVYIGNALYFSDRDLKDNIQPLQNSLTVIQALNPKTYTFKTNQFPYLSLSHGVQDGLIAQDVEQILPGAVGSFKVPKRIDQSGNLDTTGTGRSFKALNYVSLIPYLIGAVKEQELKIDSLSHLTDSLKTNDSLMSLRMDHLEQLINSCCNNGSHQRSVNPAIDVELSNSIILYQNDPNPFTSESIITYDIPGSVSDAKIIFFDNLGHIIQTVKINERGPGQLNVYASNLSSGMYSYSLIADGKVIDTKKMVVTK